MNIVTMRHIKRRSWELKALKHQRMAALCSYLRALDYLSRLKIKEGVEQLREALKDDPQNKEYRDALERWESHVQDVQ